MHIPLLSILIWLPILGAIPVAMLNNVDRENQARLLALMIALFSLIMCIPLCFGFNTSIAEMQFMEHFIWIPTFGINYDLGIDGISMPLIILSCFTTLLVVLASWTMVGKNIGQYLSAFLVIQGTTIGVFSALDAILFYFFWESMLIPMYLSIGIWGMKKRSYAAIKFFLYAFIGSALLLIALMYLHVRSESFYFLDYYKLHMSMSVQILIFLSFLIAFAIKVPIWPFHTWLLDVHTEGPIGGSVALMILMLKIGGYGFFRLSLPIVPDASRYLDWLMIGLSLITIVYIGIITIAQTDMKKLIAYASIAHMGFVTFGAFMSLITIRTGNYQSAYLGFEGAIIQMITHSFSSSAMFLSFGILYEQLGSQHMCNFGGVAKIMPYFATFFMISSLSNISFPGTAGFVGEFMILLSTFKTGFWITFLAAATLIIGAVYTLRMYKRVFYGPLNVSVVQLVDVRLTEKIIFTLTTMAIIWIGLYPNILLNVLHTTSNYLLQEAMDSKL
ncbi:complex I subunit 4 family protein [Coxiella endosymbiont of Amblyomma americanum]|uniref:complex I subunit 4 family protein n=1 Tax=Coxiella endosymbiont of Amblyomma americanum TaxID=325775 RepID=UPI00057E9A41|nr:NADH-quinone oxidoreductase subunit M [Coxiella endosymbiont of Amblyomma americanum]AJC50280.1 NADH:ubiquinone oxidoreductase subunit M [Coxiella endosymbiont of Amblyomma americanum]AUJ58634.1 NADH-quinone oxidoreductase subunit M [Coxiella-like endosymbiont of Amblyomma americanum]